MRTINIPNEVLLPEVTSLLNEGYSVTLKTKGNSMLPFIVSDRDSVVFIQAKKIKKGDIVLAKTTSDDFVVHRVIKLKNEYAILMGDGNIRGNEQCHIDDIAGKAITIIRNNKYINTASKEEKWKVYLWLFLRPIRRYLLAIYRRTIYRYENKKRI
jgi:hypothetical protein